ncbi:hypothetical protein [Bacillus sp. FJAT-27245]|uniref:hypothetical protein n=1 Tax=Bacillus sp. FJAT-27245 TaxID=1684144 RepID=UPI0006A7B54A|nr:hypothetical protein [Bacillus sp. FJAT-27245]
MKQKLFVLCLFLVSFFLITFFTNGTEKEHAETAKDSIETIKQSNDQWEVRSEYVKDGEVLLEVFPDPALHAGKSFGYIFHFKEPYETFKGKKLSIYAYPEQMGEKIIALPPETIKEPTSGYRTLERFPVIFEVPRGGLWRYEVLLDDKFYADVVLLVKRQDK